MNTNIFKFVFIVALASTSVLLGTQVAQAAWDSGGSSSGSSSGSSYSSSGFGNSSSGGSSSSGSSSGFGNSSSGGSSGGFGNSSSGGSSSSGWDSGGFGNSSTCAGCSTSSNTSSGGSSSSGWTSGGFGNSTTCAGCSTSSNTSGSWSSSGFGNSTTCAGCSTTTYTPPPPSGGGGGGGGGGGCTHNCNPPTPKPAPTCYISVNPSHIDKGDDIIITWSSTNANSATLSGFGSVSPNDSRFVSNVKESKTYTLTVTGNGKTATCHDTVKVEEEEEDDLQCKLKASDSTIDRGDSVKISWSSEGAEWGKISPTIGEVDEDGSETVRPRETTTYKGTFYNDDGDKVTCSVKVKVDEDYDPPVYYPPHTPYVTLSAVPYTGFELGPVGTAIYWTLLALWCLIAAYLIAVKKAHVGIARRLNTFLFGTSEVAVATAPVATVVHTAPVKVVPLAHTNAVDEFVLSQLARGRHA